MSKIMTLTVINMLLLTACTESPPAASDTLITAGLILDLCHARYALEHSRSPLVELLSCAEVE